MTDFDLATTRLIEATDAIDSAIAELDRTRDQQRELHATLVINYADQVTDGIHFPDLRERPSLLLVRVLEAYRKKLRPT